ncbi:MAG: [Fe-S]-binding protein [Deltaproteobacteria bacterium SG8_13]|nr:MAG: [Fe-S]-binding protein [Deltaproteobacteria bacterium SG8_13]
MAEDCNSWVVPVTLSPPSLQDNTADADRLAKALKTRLAVDPFDLHIDLETLHRIPELLRKSNYSVRCTLARDRSRWFLTGIHGGAEEGVSVGLAVDLGTTKVVLRAIDLSTGRVFGEKVFDNPQIDVGADILTRVHYAGEGSGLQDLHRQIIEAVNWHAEDLCRGCGLTPEQVLLMAVAGNTTMTHLFLGLTPYWIIREPYIPVVNRPGLLRARDLGIRAASAARVFVFPNIGSYFGGDVIAGILSSGLHEMEQTAVLVDVGTNAEVVLGNRQWLIACAGAAGPALEGGVTQMGTTAGPGVIDRVRIDSETRRFDIHTIDDGSPCGICGSGLIDLAAEMLTAGMIDIRGRFLADSCPGRFVQRDGAQHLVLLPPAETADGPAITISQADFDSLIRSKAAMYTILETIAGSVGINLQEIDRYFVAGTFGAFIRPDSAITIGMLPDLPRERFQVLGNSSLEGATKVLTSPGSLEVIDHIRDRITYLELNVNQDFMLRFSAAKFLPHTDLGRFPSVAARLPPR